MARLPKVEARPWRSEAPLWVPDAAVLGLAVSADGRTLAVSLDDRSVQLLNLVSGQPTHRVRFEAPVVDLDLSASVLLVCTDDAVTRVHTVQGTQLGHLALPSCLAVAVAPDGLHAAVVDAEGGLRLVRLATGREVRHVPGLGLCLIWPHEEGWVSRDVRGVGRLHDPLGTAWREHGDVSPGPRAHHARCLVAGRWARVTLEGEGSVAEVAGVLPPARAVVWHPAGRELVLATASGLRVMEA